jgi:hypothetical protein
LQTNFEMGNKQCLYYNMALKNNKQNTHFVSRSTQTHTHTQICNNATLPQHTLAIYTKTGRLHARSKLNKMAARCCQK